MCVCVCVYSQTCLATIRPIMFALHTMRSITVDIARSAVGVSVCLLRQPPAAAMLPIAADISRSAVGVFVCL